MNCAPSFLMDEREQSSDHIRSYSCSENPGVCTTDAFSKKEPALVQEDDAFEGSGLAILQRQGVALQKLGRDHATLLDLLQQQHITLLGRLDVFATQRMAPELAIDVKTSSMLRAQTVADQLARERESSG